MVINCAYIAVALRVSNLHLESKKLETCFKLYFFPKSAGTFPACGDIAKSSKLIFYFPQPRSGSALMFFNR